ncbi:MULTISPECIES: hypothetical protein [unclassified Streptomyces]|uniref:hypothetical protein n=1 Tax=unclassified Streptomyces TaxID=2593676 RepID=UPI000AF2932D|nr:MULTISPECIES: hypothetical protein [unclassified Streptomyces]
MALLLLLVLVGLVLGIIGVAAEGLGYLLIIGIVVLVAALGLIAVRWSQRSRHHPIR